MFIVKPVSGARVRHPDTKKVLDDEGCKIPAISTYWHRRVMDGSVVISEISPAAQAEPKKMKKGSDEQ